MEKMLFAFVVGDFSEGLFMKMRGLCFIFVLICIGYVSAADISQSLVGHWTFDESEGSHASDYSGFNNHGTLVGDPMWQPGRVGGALLFDGERNYVDCGNEPAFNITGSITVSAWIKVNAFNKSQAIVAKGRGSWSLRGNTDGTLGFRCAGANVERSGFGIVVGNVDVNDGILKVKVENTLLSQIWKRNCLRKI